MTLQELSVEYRAHARALDFRICQLSTMFREARELAVLTERYYERGYRRNVKYTI